MKRFYICQLPPEHFALCCGPDAIAQCIQHHRNGNYRMVGEITGTNLDDVFAQGNDPDVDWGWNGHDVRSVSMSDLVVTETGQVHLCTAKGWKSL